MKYISASVVLASLLLTTSFVFAQTTLTDGDASSDECISLQMSLLRFGSRDASTNGEVTVLQDFLISKGMLGGQTTGYYGKLTVAAVKAYQKSVGVSATGNVGPLTKSVIAKETCTTGTSTNSVSTNVQPATPQLNTIAPSAPSSRTAYRMEDFHITVTKVSLPNIYANYTNLPSSGVDVVNQSTGQSIWRQELTTQDRFSGSIVISLPNYIADNAANYGSYKLRAFGSNDETYTTSDSFYIGGKDVVTPAATINSFNVTSSSVIAGQGVTVSWSASQATNCSMYRLESNGGRYTIASNVGTATSYTVYPTVSTNYILSCAGTADRSGKDAPTAEKSFYINVLQPVVAAPTCQVTASSPTPSTYPYPNVPGTIWVRPYSSVTINWTSQNADYASVGGNKDNPNGSLTYTNLTGYQYLYDVTVYGKGGSSTCTETVIVEWKG